MRIGRNFNKDKLFFTSDTHFFHENVIKHCNRPFQTVKEMNEHIIQKWNEVVPKDATVFHLGDVSLTADPHELEEVLRRLNGDKYLIMGNHERDALGRDFIRYAWDGVFDIAEIIVKDKDAPKGSQHLVMCHYPMIEWNGSQRGSWQLFGHLHGEVGNKGITKHPTTSLDVGVDKHNFTPLSYQQVKDIINSNKK
jgi:calcineurin-like phosphoesterase family protein